MGKLRMYGYYFMNFLTRGARLKKGEIAADALVTKYNSVLKIPNIGCGKSNGKDYKK